MKKIIYLLTGASGNLGSSISRQLISEGNNVRSLILKGDPAAVRIPKESEIFFGDVTDNDSLEKFFMVEDDTEVIVIHCASIVTVSPEYNEKVYEVNVNGTKNIVNKCIDHNVKKLVYISSTGAIPEKLNGESIIEVDNFNPDSVIGFYGKTKAEATQIVIDAVKENRLNASIVYPTGICGPYDYAFGYFSKFVIDYVKGNMPVGIKGSFNAVDVRDLANGVIACCKKGRKGEGYIMGNTVVSMKDIFYIISKATGVKQVKLILPIWIAHVIALISSTVSKITKKPASLTSFAIYNLVRNNSFSSRKSEKELGYKVRPFEETIIDSINWLKAEKKI